MGIYSIKWLKLAANNTRLFQPFTLMASSLAKSIYDTTCSNLEKIKQHSAIFILVIIVIIA